MTKQTKEAAAVLALCKLAVWDATPEQIQEVAEKFEMEAWQLEGYYWDAREAAANETTD